jgi:hypothetical protein
MLAGAAVECYFHDTAYAGAAIGSFVAALAFDYYSKQV